MSKLRGWTLVSLLAGIVACVATPANAAPVTWTFVSGPVTGSLAYDANTNTYSSLSLATSYATFSYVDLGTYGPAPSSVSLRALQALSLNAGDFLLELSFASPLTNLGGTIDYAESSKVFTGAQLIPYAPPPYSGPREVQASAAVPEPDLATPLGAMLLALQLARWSFTAQRRRSYEP